MLTKILIQFPSKSRPDKFLDVFKRYQLFAKDKHNIFINVSCDVHEESMNCDYVEQEVNKYKNARISYNHNSGKIEAVNAGFDDLEYDIILLASDDMIPEVVGYDKIIRDYMNCHFPDGDGILHFNDGHHGEGLSTLSILGKKYYDRFGYIYHPEYKSLWCDVEYTRVAEKLEKKFYTNRIIIRHMHPFLHAHISSDDLYAVNQTFHHSDEAIFRKREKNNFDLD